MGNDYGYESIESYLLTKRPCEEKFRRGETNKDKFLMIENNWFACQRINPKQTELDNSVLFYTIN